MLNKEDVTFYDTYAFNGEPPSMKLTSETYHSGFALLHPLTKQPYINPSIYQAKMSYSSGIKIGSSFNFTTIDVPIETCDVNKFNPNYKELFRKKDLDNLYCAKYIDFLLQGHRAYDVYSYLNIQFFPCVNSSENNYTCTPKENITKLLTQFGVNFALQDVELIPEDYKSPTKPRLKDVSLTVSSNLSMDVYSYLQVINIETDEDIVGLGTSNNMRRGKYLKYDQSQMLYSPGKLNLEKNEVPLINFIITLSEQELTETRTYPKLVAVIGDVGGFMEIIFSGFSLLAAILTETLYQKSLVNHLFSFDLDKKLVLVKQNDIIPLKKSKSIKIYSPEKLLKINITNNMKEKEKESNKKDIKNTKSIKDVDSQKTKDLSNSKSKKKVILFSKKTSGYSPIFDMKVKLSQMSKNNSDPQLEDSSRIFGDKKNILKEKNIEINKIKILDLDKPDKTSNNSKDSNIITRIELNQFKPKFCYKKKREHFEKILLEEGMKIILKKLDVQNLFKKIYKDNPQINGSEESEYIEMSGNCKIKLRNVLDGEVRTLVI